MQLLRIAAIVIALTLLVLTYPPVLIAERSKSTVKLVNLGFSPVVIEKIETKQGVYTFRTLLFPLETLELRLPSEGSAKVYYSTKFGKYAVVI